MARIWDLTNIPYLTERQYLDFKVEPDCDDVIAVGGNLSPGMLLSAYRQGIFPWYNEGEDIMWWSPRERFVLFPESLHLSKSLRRRLRKEFSCAAPRFELSLDRAFEQVISLCGSTHRNSSGGTWISPELRAAYNDLHLRGYAHSVECWLEGQLVGALYGVCTGAYTGAYAGRCFFGESMFSLVPDASKMAFAVFAMFLREKGFRLIDCQQESAHLGRFGAELITREEFHLYLRSHGDPAADSWPDSDVGSYVGSWLELWPEFPSVVL